MDTKYIFVTGEARHLRGAARVHPRVESHPLRRQRLQRRVAIEELSEHISSIKQNVDNMVEARKQANRAQAESRSEPVHTMPRRGAVCEANRIASERERAIALPARP